MSDSYSKQKRSDIMSHIFGKETKPEILAREFLFANGFRFRKNVKELPDKQVGPLLTTQWHQCPPYNSMCLDNKQSGAIHYIYV
jgi:G:T-mismatch repair DNA endonuclease (very short patch repair protein)